MFIVTFKLELKRETFQYFCLVLITFEILSSPYPKLGTFQIFCDFKQTNGLNDFAHELISTSRYFYLDSKNN